MSSWSFHKRAAAAVIDEYDSEAGQSTSTETPDADLSAGRSRLRRMLGWLLGQSTPEEKHKLVHRGRPRRRHVHRHCMLAVPTHILLHALVRKLDAGDDEGGVRDEAEELSALMRRQLRHELHESTLRLLDGFELLAADAPTPFAEPPGERGPEYYEALSDRFIDELCALMLRANYRLFSQREWQFAQKENFMFTLPVTPAWEMLDSTMISRLFLRHPHLGLQSAQLARRVLVFHRGSGLVTNTSFFLEEKLDMLLDRLVTNPFRRLWQRLVYLLCPGWAGRAHSSEDASLEHGSHADAAQDAVRISFDRVLPSMWVLLRRLFCRLTLQEPTFQETVIVYAQISSEFDSEITSSSGTVPMARISDAGGPGGIERPVLRLKSFRDIPIADVEVVLPGIRVDGMKSADIVKLVVILLAGIATAIYSYAFATSTGWTVRATLIGILGLRAFQTWRSVINSKITMEDFIRTTLYCRSQDSQRGVLLSVVNSIEQHEHRETLMLYFLTLAAGDGPIGSFGEGNAEMMQSILVSEADLWCSEFLKEEFDIAVRVNVHEAFKRLLRLGLVVASDRGHRALPLPQAIKQLRHVWANQPQETTAPPRQPVALQRLFASPADEKAPRSPTLRALATNLGSISRD